MSPVKVVATALWCQETTSLVVNARKVKQALRKACRPANSAPPFDFRLSAGIDPDKAIGALACPLLNPLP